MYSYLKNPGDHMLSGSGHTLSRGRDNGCPVAYSLHEVFPDWHWYETIHLLRNNVSLWQSRFLEAKEYLIHVAEEAADKLPKATA